MSTLWLNVEASPGSDISDAAREAIALADKLQSTILFNFNRVRCMACPGDDAQSLEDAYLKELDSKKSHKLARGKAREAEPLPPLSTEVRAALLFALWHHQGASSKVGQPLRKILGIGQFDILTPEQLQAAKRVGKMEAA